MAESEDTTLLCASGESSLTGKGERLTPYIIAQPPKAKVKKISYKNTLVTESDVFRIDYEEFLNLYPTRASKMGGSNGFHPTLDLFGFFGNW